MLHLVHHRNLNQHRHSIWWRSFSVFRRELSHFVAEYNAYQPSAAAQKPSAKASKVAARRAAARLDAWRRHHVPNWYLAFSHVVASTQFSAIGLALLAVLARVTQLTGITAAYEDEAEQAMQAVLRELAATDARQLLSDGIRSPRGEGVASEDLGEVVGRMEDVGEVMGRGEADLMEKEGTKGDGMDLPLIAASDKKKKKGKRTKEPEPKPEPEAKEPPKKKKKSKKAKGSAIDDLFAGL
ncbi:Ribonuclease MRP protein subunit rmp1 [Diplodia seriata]